MENLFSFLSFLSSTHSGSFDATSETLNSTDTVNDIDFDSDNTSENTTNASSVSTTENTYKRRLLYIENFAKSTETCSSLAGIHLSQRNVPVFTIRHKKTYYTMNTETTLSKEGYVKLRCKSRDCKAKENIPCSDTTLLDKNDLIKLIDPDIWTLIESKNSNHTCDQSVVPYASDKENFSRFYKNLKIELDDINGKTAWSVATSRWKTGVGTGFDALIHGVQMDHQDKVYYARKRNRETTNEQNTAPKELIIGDKYQNIAYTILSEPDGFPLKSDKKWYRKTDNNGNIYFQTSEDSKLMYESRDLFIDGTFRPVGGLKKNCSTLRNLY